MTKLEEILADLRQASDPVAVIRAHVLAEGGLWLDPAPRSGPDHRPSIVEIHLAGLVGIGPSVGAATDDWVLQAQARGRPQVGTPDGRSA
jgi:hypothetical protein